MTQRTSSAGSDTKKNACIKTIVDLVEARRLELLTLTLPA